MNKLITIVAAFATTTSLYVTSAEAGCGGGGYRSAYRAAARVSKPRQQSVAAVKPEAKDESKTVAEAQPAAKTETVALNTAPVTENSSITVGADKVASVESSSITVASDPVKISETKKTAEIAKAIEPVKTSEPPKSKPAVAKLDCKKFFPSAGLTLTVPCE
jgi:hypothetical protein